MKKVFLRTEASKSIGSGHLRRSLILLQRLLNFGLDCSIITSSQTSALFPEIISQFKILTVPEVSTEISDAEATAALIKSEPAIIIVDHYNLGKEWEQRLSSSNRLIVALDDLNREHLAKIIIDQNFRNNYQSRYCSSVNTVKLAGPRYAVLADTYKQQRQSAPEYLKRQQRIVCSFGGSELKELFLKTAAALKNFNYPGWSCELIAGRSLGKDTDILAIPTGPGFNIIPEVADLAQHFNTSQIALGAGGTMNWERLSAGIPSLVLTVADNQQEINSELSAAGLINYLGKTQDFEFSRLPQILTDFINDQELRLKLHRSGQALVDARGAGRICSHIIAAMINFNNVTSADSLKILDWRNAEINRKYSINPEVISEAAHQNWFARVLSSETTELLIAEYHGEEIAVIRLDYQENPEISIYLVPGFHGKGLGAAVLLAAESYIIKKKQTQMITARILRQNIASRKVFEDAGYQLQSDSEVQCWQRKVSWRYN